MVKKKKKPGFGEMAEDQVRPSFSVKGLLDDDDDESVEAKDINKANKAKTPPKDKRLSTKPEKTQ